MSSGDLENRALKALIKSQEDEIFRLNAELTEARNESDIEDVDEGISAAYWDEKDSVFRCPDCDWEVMDGLCHNYDCGKESSVDDEMDDMKDFSDSTNNEAASEDRTLVCRGDTPTKFDFDWTSPCETVGATEMLHLLSRGATREMCETFKLEWTDEGGMYAWADQATFDSFSGKMMEEGDRWKIYLGRRIQLDHDDINGSAFVEGLLEDAFLFATSGGYEASVTWGTKKDLDGVWVSRPIPETAPKDDDVLNLDFSESEWDMTPEECLAMDEGRDTPGLFPARNRHHYAEVIDLLFDEPRPLDSGPVLTEDVYESSEASSDSEEDAKSGEDMDNEYDDDEPEAPLGRFVPAGVPDATFNPSEEDEEASSDGDLSERDYSDIEPDTDAQTQGKEEVIVGHGEMEVGPLSPPL